MKRLACLTALALLVCGMAAASTDSAGTPTGTVAFIGDSNLVRSASAIANQLLNRDHGWIVIDASRPGATIRTADCPEGTGIPLRPCATYDYWQARLAAVLKPDVWVLDLGINDTARPGTATTPGYAAYSAKIDWLLGLIDGPVLWTNLPCKIEPAANRKGCTAVNAALAAAPARHPNLTVIDWATTANGHRGYLGTGNNGVHLTPTGQAAYAALVAHTLDSMH